jgi:phosphoribosyl 1,2-cyclic phosphodiesterase
LIDAGISGKRAGQFLSRLGVPRIDALFITHEHSDHISGAGVLARRFKTPVYAAPKTWRYLKRHNVLGPLDESLQKMIPPNVSIDVCGVEVRAFDIPHDASQPVGYTFISGGVKTSVATDIGHVTETVRSAIMDSNILLLESNHDLEMLINGRYPQHLKERVMGNRGHLSNASAGALLAEVASPALQYAYLGHLSEENNRPLIALDTVRNILEAKNVTVKILYIADRGGPSETVEVIS